MNFTCMIYFSDLMKNMISCIHVFRRRIKFTYDYLNNYDKFTYNNKHQKYFLLKYHAYKIVKTCIKINRRQSCNT